MTLEKAIDSPNGELTNRLERNLRTLSLISFNVYRLHYTTTPELAHPLLTTTPPQREDFSALNRFNVHRCPTWWIFSGAGLELVTRQATIRYLYHSATAAIHYTVSRKVWKCESDELDVEVKNE
ncbi:uncharacterized protein TNCV_940651 [Trichonephila clavipes]|nr:uncharacterized protein TNCV_940651 [Trichonephila clavipes]